MSVPTLSDLLSTPTQDEVLEQEVLPELRGRGVRVTDWVVGGVYRAMAYVVALMRADDRKSLAAMAAAGFEDYAFGLVSPPNGIDVTSWCDLVAQQRYGLQRIAATYTVRQFTLTNSTSTAYGPLTAGAILCSMSSGNRYVLDETVTIPGSGSVNAKFRSEFVSDSLAGRSYTDPSGDTIAMVTANFPGVTVTNPAPTFSSVAQAGTGVGIVTPSGTPIGSHTVAVKIDVGGTVAGGTVSWSTSLDGAAWVPQSGSTAIDVGGSGITVTLADNGGSPAFSTGAIYYLSTPGSDIVQAGRDQETPQELGTRCRQTVSVIAFERDDAGNALPLSPTLAGYELLAKSASDQIKICFAVTDQTVNDQINIYVAGQGVLLGAGVIAATQWLLSTMAMLTDRPVVLSPTTRAVTITGATVYAKQSLMATAKAAAQRAILLYLGGVDPANKLSINGRIDHAYICALIRNTVGVVRLTDTTLQINSTAPGDYQMPGTAGAYELAVMSGDIASSLTWVGV